MDVGLMVEEIPFVANSMIGKPALPDFPLAADDGAKGVRISTLDKLHGVFERDVMRWRQQQVNMFRHHDEGVELKMPFASITIDCLQEQANMVLDHKEPSTLPGSKRHEIRSGWGDQAYRLQEQTSAAEAAIFA